jgi:acyl-[acyl-carrier-protein]-phospholipid O-acyltransferase/long-chain-fatty-acid--[acyl-carrier-protein] ligase
MTATPSPAAPTHVVPPASERGFWAFIILQFQNAFSDNVFKQFMILGLVTLIWKQASEQSAMNGLINAIFILPPLLFSTWAGFLADKYSKRVITLVTKLMEIVFMIAGSCALMLDQPFMAFCACLGIMFLLGTQAALFSPTKYGLIPELVRPERLAWANGVVELTTFVAIIMGTGFATPLLNMFSYERYHFVGFLLVGLAVVGFIAGLRIDKTPAANPTRKFEVNFFPALVRYIRLLKQNRRLGLTVLGLSYFWGLGIVLLTQMNVWGQHALKMEPHAAGWLAVVLSLGIGLGAMAAGLLSRGRIELGLVPLGGIGLTVFALPMAFATEALRLPMYFCLFMVGISAGFFSLPLNAVLQHDTKLEERGGFLAANNFFNSVAMVLGSVLLSAFSKIFDPAPTTVFFFCAGGTLAATVVLMILLPESFLRFVGFLATRTIYRFRVTGLEHLPAQGPALLVANHVSFIDALFVMTISPRPVRFLVWQGLFEKPLLRWFLTQTRCIPVSSQQRPRELLKSLRTASDALNNGEVLCIFAEGEITRTGRLLPFRRGYEYILKNAPAPVVPLYMDGVWGSIFSFEGNKFFWKMPKQFPYHVRIAIGAPLPSDTPPWRLRQRITELGADSAIAGKATALPLHRTFIRVARQNWGNFYALDLLTPGINLGQALWRAIILARRLVPLWEKQETVGVLLPPTVGAALVNIAASLSGRTIVNLNYTTGPQVLEHCAKVAGLKTIVTARAFLEKLNLTVPEGITPIYLEDHRGYQGLPEVLKAMLLARLAPARMIEKYCGVIREITPDTLATIIFSSGSTGMPKGVMLSHYNISANVESFKTGVRVWPQDRLLGTLPFFHSFGYTVSLWGALHFPFGVVFHVSPLDVKTIGELCEKKKVTLIVTTPTFLSQYMRRIPAEQFGGVNTIITGAEKLTDALRTAFKEQIGIEPLQGYGTTELSPVVSTNINDFRAPGFRQQGQKPGSIGQPLPGMAVSVRRAEDGAPLPPGESGLLWVRGANVMQGYLGMKEKTAEVLQDGWYNTGDMAYMDEDGFVFITGRLSRFSKIGGEMVPHVAIEDKLHEVLGLNDPSLVVTAVPDENKGERLIVLHTLNDDKLAGFAEKLAAAGLPNLWIPRRENFRKIEALPVLGTGKLDLRRVNELAKELA